VKGQKHGDSTAFLQSRVHPKEKEKRFGRKIHHCKKGKEREGKKRNA